MDTRPARPALAPPPAPAPAPALAAPPAPTPLPASAPVAAQALAPAFAPVSAPRPVAARSAAGRTGERTGGERQHAATTWVPTGARARYEPGGERERRAAPLPPPLSPPPPSAPGPGVAAPTVGSTSADGLEAGAPPGPEAPWAFQRQAHWEMPAQPGSVRAARHCSALLLSSWGVGTDDVEQIVLLVSELTTNATLHGRRDMSVDLTLAGSHVDLTVSDYGPVVSGRGEKLPADECGRGLEIANALADGLHIQRHRTGTNAWASYRLSTCRHR